MLAQTGDYRTAASVGAVVGVILVMIRSLVNWDGRGIRYQDMFMAVVLWMILYSPGVRVSIEDAYTGDVRVVDNVPLGPARSAAFCRTWDTARLAYSSRLSHCRR